ncbi:hypothetical protein CRUP_004801 [Coryphaenoides rupestris]|nr:hypothetical protein CRUP_004801 [Coryphaenoides rupestris]
MNPLSFIALKKMLLVTLFLSSVASVAKDVRIQVTLEGDRPFMRRMVTEMATLECCYSGRGKIVETWIVNTGITKGTHPQMVNIADDRVKVEATQGTRGSRCSSLVLTGLRLSDAGLYQCCLNSNSQNISTQTHGTYLQVYKPVEKILKITEHTKNNILTAQGILLLLCVLLPGAKILCKSKQIHALEKKKALREEENIYEGLRIEDFSSPYDQIQRTQGPVTYQDVYLREADTHLEKP